MTSAEGLPVGDLSHHFLFQVALMHFISTALKTCLENECVKEHTYFFLSQKELSILVLLLFQVLLRYLIYLLGAISYFKLRINSLIFEELLKHFYFS